MKQHIFMKDILNLTEDQQIKIKALADIEFEAINNNKRELMALSVVEEEMNLIDTSSVKSSVYCKYFNIGKMIEILDKNSILSDAGRIYDTTSDWTVKIQKFVKYEEYEDEVLEEFIYEGEELADVLWEAIKEVL